MDGRRPPPEAIQHVALDIDPAWMESVKVKAGNYLQRKPPYKPTIFKVPPSVREGNWSAYKPTLVSIGPYHRGKSEDMKAMEELKWRLLHNYLSKVPNGSKNVGLREMKRSEQRARNCYSKVIDMDSNEFVEMLLLDGCFLVQIFLVGSLFNNTDEDTMGEELRSLLLDDTVKELRSLLLDDTVKELRSLLFDNMWLRDLIFRDLLLLENQLPYFIIEHLLDMLRIPGWDSSRLQNAAVSLFGVFLSPYPRAPQQELPLEVDHLLHLFHNWTSTPTSKEPRCGSDSEEPRCGSDSEEVATSIPTMTELAEAGVKIEVSGGANSFLDISFCKDQGVLRIPDIHVDDHTNFIFANLIAWEQYRPGTMMYVSEYSKFMDDIINTSSDVELLHQNKVILRDLGNNEDIASLFNKLCKGVVYDQENSHLKKLYEDLNDFCQSRWPRWRAKAVHDYFGNPWAFISFVAAVLLLGLTILQSVYAVLDYYKADQPSGLSSSI